MLKQILSKAKIKQNKNEKPQTTIKRNITKIKNKIKSK